MMLSSLFAQATTLREACGDAPGLVCQWVFDRTDAAWALLLGRSVSTVLRILLISVLSWIATRVVRRLVKRFVRGLGDEHVGRLTSMRRRAPLADTAPTDLARATMRAETIASVLRSVATFAIWTIAVFLILGELNFNLGPLLASAGIAGVAIGFGAQSLVKDFLSGIFMLLEDQYGIGDIVDVGEATGTVEMISLRSTRLRDVYGTVWHVPNGQINRIGNFSQQWSRALLDIGVAYDTDIDHAFAVIKRVADEAWQHPDWHGAIQEEPALWGVENFAADGIIIRLVVKTTPKRQFEVNRYIRRRLKEAFDAEGITIPFPQRTVWMHEAGANGAEGTRTDGHAQQDKSGASSELSRARNPTETVE